MTSLDPHSCKTKQQSYDRQRAYWPTLYKSDDGLILARPRRVRILTDSREEFFEKLAKAREYFAELVKRELPAFAFSHNQKVEGQKKPGAWKAPLTIENYEAVVAMCDHYGEVLLNLSNEIEEWLEETKHECQNQHC